MIQRKQTLFLLACILLTGALFYINLATLQNSEATWTMTATGIYKDKVTTGASVLNTYPIVSLLIISTLTSFLSIFSYKKRVLQLRLCGLNLAFQAGISGIAYYIGQSAAAQLSAVISYEWAIIAPVIAIVFNILAMMSISKDEALVKSLNRIR